MLLETILTAITTRFENSLVRPATAGLFYGSAPRDTDAPYVTYHLIDGRQEYDMSSRLEDQLIQFDVWSADKSPTEAIRIAELLCVEFDDTTLDVTDGTLVRIDRERYTVVEDEDAQGWRVSIDYRLLVQEA